MKKLLVTLLSLFLITPAFADEVIFATKEDLAAFDAMVGKSRARTKPTAATETTSVDLQKSLETTVVKKATLDKKSGGKSTTASGSSRVATGKSSVDKKSGATTHQKKDKSSKK